MGQQRLERRSAPRAFPGAALGAMDAAGEEARPPPAAGRRIWSQSRAMGDATDDNGVDVEPEAEREHQATVAPPSSADQLRGRRYVPEEEGVVPDGVGSR